MRTFYFFTLIFIYALRSLFFYPKYYIIGKTKGDYEQFLYANKVVKDWFKRALKATGSTFDIIGKNNIPSDKTILIVSNHQSHGDIAVLGGLLDIPFGFISKKELNGIPIFSNWMRRIKCVFMDRSTPRKSMQGILEATDNINGGYSQAIFPEGTRSKSNNFGIFKKGSLKVALKTNVTIVPITVINTHKMFEEEGKIKKANIKVIIHKSIKPSELDEDIKKDLAEYIKNIIENGMKKNAE